MKRKEDIQKPKELNSWDFSDRIQVPDGYDLKTIPDMTRDNMQTLIEEHNHLVRVVLRICQEKQIIFEI